MITEAENSRQKCLIELDSIKKEKIEMDQKY